MLYLPRLDQWFTGEGAAYYGGLREALTVAVEGLPPSAAVMVLATYEVHGFVVCARGRVGGKGGVVSLPLSPLLTVTQPFPWTPGAGGGGRRQ